MSEHQPRRDRDARSRLRRRRLVALAAGVVLVPVGLGVLHTWYFAILFGYLLLATAARAAMTHWFGPEWQDVPPDVSGIRHLRGLRRERRAEAPGASAPVRSAS